MSPAAGETSTSVLTSEIFQLFSCCALKGTSSSSQSNPNHVQRNGNVGRKRIDASMISGPDPSTFRHMAHLGSTDVDSGEDSVFELQAQMASKGGWSG